MHGLATSSASLHPRRLRSGWLLLAVATLIFAASVAATIACAASMSAMGSMPMPGGWTLSMAWMRMGGPSWLGTAASFLAMWAPMMVAMMLPALLPPLWRYRPAAGQVGEARLVGLTALTSAGYFAVWIGLGVPLFAAGAALAALALHSPLLARAVPALIAATILLAGAFQFSAWKAHQLACCRTMSPGDGVLSVDFLAAWRQGLRHGAHCSLCCAGFTATLLALGVMDWRVMIAVTAATAFERVAAAGVRAARVVGVAMLGAGMVLAARALGFG